MVNYDFVVSFYDRFVRNQKFYFSSGHFLHAGGIKNFIYFWDYLLAGNPLNEQSIRYGLSGTNHKINLVRQPTNEKQCNVTMICYTTLPTFIITLPLVIGVGMHTITSSIQDQDVPMHHLACRNCHHRMHLSSLKIF